MTTTNDTKPIFSYRRNPEAREEPSLDLTEKYRISNGPGELQFMVELFMPEIQRLCSFTINGREIYCAVLGLNYPGKEKLRGTVSLSLKWSDGNGEVFVIEGEYCIRKRSGDFYRLYDVHPERPL